jgi:hypothetical protein
LNHFLLAGISEAHETQTGGVCKYERASLWVLAAVIQLYSTWNSNGLFGPAKMHLKHKHDDVLAHFRPIEFPVPTSFARNHQRRWWKLREIENISKAKPFPPGGKFVTLISL